MPTPHPTRAWHSIACHPPPPAGAAPRAALWTWSSCLLLLTIVAPLGCSSLAAARPHALLPTPSPNTPAPPLTAPDGQPEQHTDHTRAHTALAVQGLHLSRQAERALTLVHTAGQRYHAGDPAAAQALLTRARRLDPRCRAGYRLEAQLAFDRQDRATALLMLQAHAAAYPDSAAVQHEAGLLFSSQRETRSALLALQRAVYLEPRKVAYARDLAAAYVACNKPAAAEQVLMTALYQSPRDPTLPVALARLCEREQRWQPAVFYYQLALQADPDNPRWRLQRARGWYRLHDYNRALQDFERCPPELIARGDGAVLLEYADCRERLGRHDVTQHLYAQQ